VAGAQVVIVELVAMVEMRQVYQVVVALAVEEEAVQAEQQVTFLLPEEEEYSRMVRDHLVLPVPA